MEAYLLLALCICVIGLASLIAVAITLAERVRHLEWINGELKKSITTHIASAHSNLDPYVKRAIDRANAS